MLAWLKKLLGIGRSLEPIRQNALVVPQLVQIPAQTNALNSGEMHNRDAQLAAVQDAQLKAQQHQESEERAKAALKVQLVFSDGQIYEFGSGQGNTESNEEIVVGRRTTQSLALPHRINIADSTGQTSRNHFKCGLDAFGRVWVEDLHSANGTWLRTPSGDNRIEPGVRVTVPKGATVAFSMNTMVVRSVP